MKLAWICYTYVDGWMAQGQVEILFEEPEPYRYHKVVPIVYAEIEK